jgi:hypothetical protein
MNSILTGTAIFALRMLGLVWDVKLPKLTKESKAAIPRGSA